jgi:hypothetical protein
MTDLTVDAKETPAEGVGAREVLLLVPVLALLVMVFVLLVEVHQLQGDVREVRCG